MATINFRKNDTLRNLYTGILQIKGEVSSINELPVIGADLGDAYFVNGELKYFDGKDWLELGGSSSTVIDFTDESSTMVTNYAVLAKELEAGNWRNITIRVEGPGGIFESAITRVTIDDDGHIVGVYTLDDGFNISLPSSAYQLLSEIESNTGHKFGYDLEGNSIYGVIDFLGQSGEPLAMAYVFIHNTKRGIYNYDGNPIYFEYDENNIITGVKVGSDTYDDENTGVFINDDRLYTDDGATEYFAPFIGLAVRFKQIG